MGVPVADDGVLSRGEEGYAQRAASDTRKRETQTQTGVRNARAPFPQAVADGHVEGAGAGAYRMWCGIEWCGASVGARAGAMCDSDSDRAVAAGAFLVVVGPHHLMAIVD